MCVCVRYGLVWAASGTTDCARTRAKVSLNTQKKFNRISLFFAIWFKKGVQHLWAWRPRLLTHADLFDRKLITGGKRESRGHVFSTTVRNEKGIVHLANLLPRRAVAFTKRTTFVHHFYTILTNICLWNCIIYYFEVIFWKVLGTCQERVLGWEQRVDRGVKVPHYPAPLYWADECVLTGVNVPWRG